MVAQNAAAQNPNTYGFGKITRTYTSVANSTGAVPTLTGTTDEGVYNDLPIGFTFRYAGVDYTTAAASTNGWMTLGQNLTAAQATPTNNLTAPPVNRVLAPLWDNLNMDAGGFYYQTTGSAPDRVFTADWNNVRWDNTAPAGVGTLSFQVKLYETTNEIEFIYRDATGAVVAASGGASIGITGTAAGTFLSLSDTGTNPTASASTETNNIAVKPVTGQVYAFTPSASQPNNAAAYSFVAAPGSYQSLQPNTPLSGGTDDDGYYNGLPIGFTFRFAGVDYTTAAASTNGWMTLGQNINATQGTNGFVNDLDGLSATNSVTYNNGLGPILAPLWDDLTMGSGAFYYFTSGTAPNRVFTAEWYNAKWNFQASNPAVSFQVRLYETSNRIEYTYRQESGTVNAGSASIGMSVGSGTNNFLSLNGSGAGAAISYTTETATIATKPATGQVFAFTPAVQPRLVSVAPVAGAFASIAATGTAAALSGGNLDDGYANALPIGFTFRHAGRVVTTVSASTNGWMTFGQAIANSTPANSLTAGATAPRPLVAPLWDDLSLVDGNLYYQQSGTAPNRVFTMEWNKARWNNTGSRAIISFQVKLYESSNAIEYIYSREANNAPTNASASIGTSDAVGSFLSLTGTGSTPTASTTTETADISQRPAIDQVYGFYPLNSTLSSSTATYTNGIPLSGGDADEGYYNGLPIGFNFSFDGVTHTTASVSTNGWLTLGQNITNAASANNLAGGGRRIAPLWDDISMEQGSVYYQTTGTSPRRVFTVEWYNALWEKGATSPTISFEAKLYEGSNRIEFVYRREAGAVTAAQQTASIGIAGSAANSFLSLNNSSTGATASPFTETTNISGRPATGQIYGFAPNGVNPLPVELIAFTGELQGADALLNWRTASEKNNDRFEVERSMDGREYTVVTTLPGEGSSSQPRSYAYTDKKAVQAGSTMYYRLRQVDTDGSASYSPVVALTRTRGGEMALQLVPNPAHDRVQVLGASTETVQIRDLTGRLLRTVSAAQALDLTGLSAGMYLVQSGTQTVRLQVQ